MRKNNGKYFILRYHQRRYPNYDIIPLEAVKSNAMKDLHVHKQSKYNEKTLPVKELNFKFLQECLRWSHPMKDLPIYEESKCNISLIAAYIIALQS